MCFDDLAARNKNQESGFILVSVIWFSAVAAIVIAFLSELIYFELNAEIDEADKIVKQLESRSTQETLLFLLATRERNFAGLDVERKYSPKKILDPFRTDSYSLGEKLIKFDRTLYAGLGSCLFSLQDAGSLVSLRSKTGKELENFLLSIGKDKNQARSLNAKYQDYIDRDNKARFSGAESSHYSSIEREYFPRNRFVTNSGELKNVYGWKENLNPSDFRLMEEELSIYPQSRLNPNSMTFARLKSVFKDPAIAQKIIDYRRDQEISSRQEVQELTGVIDPEVLMGIAFLPSKHIILRVFCDGETIQTVQSVTLTPDSKYRPWSVDYKLPRASKLKVEEITEESYRFSRPEIPRRYAIFANQ